MRDCGWDDSAHSCGSGLANLFASTPNCYPIDALVRATRPEVCVGGSARQRGIKGKGRVCIAKFCLVIAVIEHRKLPFVYGKYFPTERFNIMRCDRQQNGRSVSRTRVHETYLWVYEARGKHRGVNRRPVRI